MQQPSAQPLAQTAWLPVESFGARTAPPPFSSQVVDRLISRNALEKQRDHLRSFRQWLQFADGIERDLICLRAWEREAEWFPGVRPNFLQQALTAFRRHRRALLRVLRALNANSRNTQQRLDQAIENVEAI